MSKLCVPLEISKIEEAVLPIINTDDNEFWLKDVKKDSPDTIIGSKFWFQNKNNSKKFVKIVFADQKLYVTAPHAVKMQIIDAVMRLMQGVCQDVNYDKTLQQFEPYIKKSEEIQRQAYVMSLLARIVEPETGGFRYNHPVGGLKTPKFYEKAMAAAIPRNAIVDCGGHYQRIVSLDKNQFNTPKREIKHKEIYYVDLNPVYDGEFGGRRPCVVLYDTEDEFGNKNYYVIPFTHSISVANGLDVGVSKQQAVVSKLQLVSAERIYEKFGEVSDEQYLYLIAQTRKTLRYYSPDENEVKPLYDLTKKELKVGEEYGKKHTVDYDKLMNAVEIPQEEIKKIVLQRLALFSKYSFKRKENGMHDIKIYKSKDSMTCIVNEKSNDPASPQITFTFYKFNVKMEIAGVKGNFDPALTAMYYSLMDEKYQAYDVMSVLTLAARLNIKYLSNLKLKRINDEEEYIKMQTERAEKELACWNLAYDDIQGLIMSGKHGFVPNRLHRLDGIENDGEEDEKF